MAAKSIEVADLILRCTQWHKLLLKERAGAPQAKQTWSPTIALERKAAMDDLVRWECVGPDLQLTRRGTELLEALDREQRQRRRGR